MQCGQFPGMEGGGGNLKPELVRDVLDGWDFDRGSVERAAGTTAFAGAFLLLLLALLKTWDIITYLLLIIPVSHQLVKLLSLYKL